MEKALQVDVYRFPPNRKAARSLPVEQAAKVVEEAAEVVAEVRYPFGADMACELWDTINACEGMLRKMHQPLVEECLERVIEKCRERGDYDG